MKDGRLSKWLYQNGCFLIKDDNRRYTHLCLDGGRLHITQEQYSDFIQNYADGITLGERYYICEQPTKVSRMYCDLDFIGEEQFQLDKVKDVVKIIHDTIEHYYDVSFDIIVCMTEPKNVVKEKQKMIKTGVHLIWENLFINQKIGMNLSKQFVKNLVTKLGERPEYNKWDEVVDECVYLTNGLRMVGSAKMSKKKAKGKEDEEKKLIKVDEGRIYNPVWAYNKEGNTFNFKDKADMINKCTIRVYEGETELETEIPEYVVPVKYSKLNKSNGVTMQSTDPVYRKLENFIRKSTIPEWNRPLKLFKKQGNFYVAKIEDGMYCLNIEKEHNSCGVYFQILEEGLVQRCFCRCKTLEGRKDGYCSDYKSKLFKLPVELKSMLFPNKKKKRKPGFSSASGGTAVFGSYSNLKNDPNRFLKMSMNTIQHIEAEISKFEEQVCYKN
jgi:hypothetical protein